MHHPLLKDSLLAKSLIELGQRKGHRKSNKVVFIGKNQKLLAGTL
jgi:hypothetical protein